MSIKTIKVHFLICIILLSACAAVPEPTEVMPIVSATGTIPTEELIVMTATEPIPTIMAPPKAPGYYPLSTRTGIADIDVVLAAVESGDPQQLRDLIHFTTVACTKAEGLGGPPKCQNNEAEGTLVKVLPILGPEGQFLRESEISSFPGLNVIGLYAVYVVSGSAYSEEAYPVGKYAAMFKAGENQPNIVIQIQGGIVRIDYLYPPTSPEEIIHRDASELILAPE
jgi:hypothetical protein